MEAHPPRSPDLRANASDADHPGYRDYLSLDALLGCQPASHSHDELMFVVVHQAHELWFKLVLHELEAVRDLLRAEHLDRAGHLLGRLAVIQRLLTEHWAVLDTMLPADFLAFRENLTGGSGFESAQYREIEFLAGDKDESYLHRVQLDEREYERLRRRLDEPSVRETFGELVRRRGMDSVADVITPDGAGPRDWGLLRIAEQLLDFDQAFAEWRARHTLMVERQIGHRSGTGGSSGTTYLRSRLTVRLFPELWEIRTRL